MQPIRDRRELTATEEKIAEVAGTEPSGWTFLPDHPDGYEASILFRHQPHRDGIGQPLTWEQLQRLDDEYDIHSIESHSDGRTGSKLAVHVNDI